MDVTEQITALLMDASKLAAAAEGNRQGKYAIVAQWTVEADGAVLLQWERYGPHMATTATTQTGEQA